MGKRGGGGLETGDLHEQGRHWQRPSQPVRLGAQVLGGRPAGPPAPRLLCRQPLPLPGPCSPDGQNRGPTLHPGCQEHSVGLPKPRAEVRGGRGREAL